MIREDVLNRWRIPGNVRKEWRQHGMTLVEVWPDVLELRQHDEIVARFNVGSAETKEIIKAAQNIIEPNKSPERSPVNKQSRIDRSGAELGKEGKFRSSCGMRASEVDPEGATQVKYPCQVATVLGYVFGFLGGWIGLVFGIYLVTRKHWRAKDQGKIILSVSVVMTVVWMFILLG